MKFMVVWNIKNTTVFNVIRITYSKIKFVSIKFQIVPIMIKMEIVFNANNNFNSLTFNVFR